MDNNVKKRPIVMFYINSLSHGGAEHAILQLAYQFSKNGYTSILVTSFVQSPQKEYAVPEEVKRISIEQEQVEQSRLKRNVSRILALREICKYYKPSVLISFMAEPNFRSIIATIGLPVKTIISVRNDPQIEYRTMMYKFVAKHILTHADGCVFQTKGAKDWFPEKLKKKSVIIMNEIDEKFFNVQYKGGNNIVMVGRLEKQKNYRLFIDAYLQIVHNHPNSYLYIYGSGSQKDELQKYIFELGMSNRIFLKGITEKVEDVLSNAGVFVLSSDYEGMPNSLMEAMAVGVPCVSTDCPCGGPKMLIENGVNGILVPTNDSQALAKAVDILLKDKDFSKTLGKKAHESAKKFYPERVFADWKVYTEKVIHS